MPKITVCGRIHLGPVCVNGGNKGQPICMSCGGNVTHKDRDTIQRMWNTVHMLLKQYKRDNA